MLGVPALGLGPMTGARVRRLAKGLSVLAVAGLLAAACGDDAGTSAEPAQATATTTTVPELPEIEDIESAGGEAIDARPFADWVTVAGDSAWVANVGAGVGRYDRATGELLESVPTQTGICLAMEQGFDSLWLGQCRSTSIMRVDLVTGEIIADITLPVGGLNDESSLAVTDDAVWALSADADRTLVGVDPATNEVIAEWAVPVGAGGVRGFEGSLWVALPTAGELIRIAPATGEEEATIEVAAGSTFVAVGEGSVWTLGATASEVSRVDPATNEVVATIDVGDGPVDGGDIAVGGGYVWARVSDSLVAQIDPATDTVVARFGTASGSGSVAADDAAVWISAHDVNTLWRLPLS